MFIHTDYLRDLQALRDFLKKLSPDELISITENVGYTVIWKSNKELDNRRW